MGTQEMLKYFGLLGYNVEKRTVKLGDCLWMVSLLGQIGIKDILESSSGPLDFFSKASL